MKNMVINLVSSFLMGLLAFYIFSGSITWLAVLVCLACVAIIACAYMVVYFIKKALH